MFQYADSVSLIGLSHEREGKPGQDYSLSQLEKDQPFAIVTDGCSMSGLTDIGSRLLALTARKIVRQSEKERPVSLLEMKDKILFRVKESLAQQVASLEIAHQDLDATLGIVLAHNDTAKGFLFGDGVLAVKRQDIISVTVMDWAGNMPGYLSYMLDEARYRYFIQESEAVAKQEKRSACWIRQYDLYPDSTKSEVKIENLSAIEGLQGWGIEVNDAEIVAVMSDGVLQVSELTGDEVIRDFMAIKTSREGEFVTRRVRRALLNFGKSNNRPIDDISMGAIAGQVCDV